MKTVVAIDYDGKPCLLESAVDITQLKLKEKQLILREKELSEAKEHYQEIFANMSEGVSVYEAVDNGNDFVFVDFNKAAEKINVTRKKDLTGKKVTDVFPGVKEFGLLDVMKRVWETGKPEFLPARLYKDARIEGYRENYVYKVSSGYIVSIHSDITEKVKSEQEIKISRERFELAVKGSSEGIWDWDLVKNEFFLSPQWKERIGYTDQGPITEFKIFLMKLHPDDRKKFMQNVNSYLRKESEKYEDEFRLKSDDGTYHWILCRGEALWKKGKPYRVAGSLTNISELKEIQEELALAMKKAEEANAAKSIFLANMSHEIRTPMNAILGFSEILETKLKEPALQGYVQSIQTSGKILLRLINDILDLSKIEAGKLELQNKPVNPVRLFNEMETVFKFKMQEKGLQFITEIEEELPEALIMDDVRLRQILLNLIGNSVKFTEKGFIKLSVNRVYREKDRSSLDLVFAIKDTGIGIPEEQMELIFEEFKQTSGQDINKYGGTGLGLAITRKLVKMMNGEISVTSQSGPEEGETGTVFTVVLKDVDVSSAQEESDDSMDITLGDIRFETGKILVVDDVELNRSLIQGFLDDQSIEVIEAENGEEAVEIVKNQSPDLVLMDLKMPVMDGYRATRLIKQDTELRHIPVIALTASIFGEEEEKISDKKFDGYLRKPVSKTNLFNELMHYMDYQSGESSGKKEAEHKDGSISNLPDAVLENYDEFINTLENQYLPELEKIKSTFILSHIGNFAKDIRLFNSAYNLAELTNWCNHVEMQVQTFDMEKLPATLNRFENIMDQVKSLNIQVPDN